MANEASCAFDARRLKRLRRFGGLEEFRREQDFDRGWFDWRTRIRKEIEKCRLCRGIESDVAVPAQIQEDRAAAYQPEAHSRPQPEIRHHGWRAGGTPARVPSVVAETEGEITDRLGRAADRVAAGLGAGLAKLDDAALWLMLLHLFSPSLRQLQPIETMPERPRYEVYTAEITRLFAVGAKASARAFRARAGRCFELTIAGPQVSPVRARGGWFGWLSRFVGAA